MSGCRFLYALDERFSIVPKLHKGSCPESGDTGKRKMEQVERVSSLPAFCQSEMYENASDDTTGLL